MMNLWEYKQWVATDLFAKKITQLQKTYDFWAIYLF